MTRIDVHRMIDGVADEVDAGRHLIDMRGTDGDDMLRGTTADERFLPYLGQDQVDGGGGSDTLVVDYSARNSAGLSQTFITGQYGEYVGQINGAGGSVGFQHIDRIVLREGAGDDDVAVIPTQAPDSLRVNGGAGNDQLQLICGTSYDSITLIHDRGPLDFMGGHYSHFEDFYIQLGYGNDHVVFGGGNDAIIGGGGDDVLGGGNGDDYLVGGAGTDLLTGGHGADIFAFTSLGDLWATGTSDRITDFSHGDGDTVDLSWIDADPTVTGTQSFNVIGAAPFDGLGTAYELRIDQTGAHDFTVQIDTNHDKVADLQFVVHADTLSASDIIG